jgi:catechol 2,3-dioxygenase-like lactoylglutathione lyase family enzyme
MEKSRHFYGDFLGFPRVGADAENKPAEYRVNSSQSIDVLPLPQNETDDLAYVAFATSNVASLRRYLLRKKVSINGKVQTQADGSQFFWVKDPEGHRIQFVQLPARRSPVAVSRKDADSEAEKPISRHILHAGFIVHDRAAEDRFYRDVLGFREAWQGGMKDGVTNWVDMQVPDGSDWIEYMLHGPAPVSAAQSGVMNHLALGVTSVHQAAGLLKQRGWHPSPREKAQIGRDGKWQLNLYDPNGTRVELMEFRPVRTPCCSPYTLPVPGSESH